MRGFCFCVGLRRRWGGGQNTEHSTLTLLGRKSVPPQVSRYLAGFLRALWSLTVAVPFSVLTCSFHSVSECVFHLLSGNDSALPVTPDHCNSVLSVTQLLVCHSLKSKTPGRTMIAQHSEVLFCRSAAGRQTWHSSYSFRQIWSSHSSDGLTKRFWG